MVMWIIGSPGTYPRHAWMPGTGCIPNCLHFPYLPPIFPHFPPFPPIFPFSPIFLRYIPGTSQGTPSEILLGTSEHCQSDDAHALVWTWRGNTWCVLWPDVHPCAPLPTLSHLSSGGRPEATLPLAVVQSDGALEEHRAVFLPFKALEVFAVHPPCNVPVVPHHQSAVISMDAPNAGAFSRRGS